jgi:hypothetical protein
LILPNLKQFSPTDRAVKAFNEVLGRTLLGGTYFDFVQATDIDQGFLYHTGYYRPFGQAKGLAGQLRYSLQTKMASPLHSILLYDPEHIYSKDIHLSYKKGIEAIAKFNTLSVDLMLQGISSFASHDWAGALSHLWITVEQVVSLLWQTLVISGGVQPKFPIENRKEFLQDYRTWVTAARLELLFQRGILSEFSYRRISTARRARNDLAHKGVLPTRRSVESLLEGLFSILDSGSNERFSTVLSKTLDTIKARNPSDRHYRLPDEIANETGLWFGPLPPLPGEKEWGDKGYEKVYEKD